MEHLSVNTIRRMQPGDAEPVADLIRRAFAAIQCRLDPAPSALRETAISIKAQLIEGGGAICVDRVLCGCVLWRKQDDALYIGRLSVDPAWQRRGIARLLLAAAETQARTLQLARLTLAVRLALTDNRRLFASAGFREVSLKTHDGYHLPTYADAEKLL